MGNSCSLSATFSASGPNWLFRLLVRSTGAPTLIASKVLGCRYRSRGNSYITPCDFASSSDFAVTELECLRPTANEFDRFLGEFYKTEFRDGTQLTPTDGSAVQTCSVSGRIAVPSGSIHPFTLGSLRTSIRVEQGPHMPTVHG